MEWPPQSPDLNPIELLWEKLDRKVRQSAPTSKSHLWKVLQEAWNEVEPQTLAKLTERMLNLCKAVIQAKGGFFQENNI